MVHINQSITDTNLSKILKFDRGYARLRSPYLRISDLEKIVTV